MISDNKKSVKYLTRDGFFIWRTLSAVTIFEAKPSFAKATAGESGGGGSRTHLTLTGRSFPSFKAEGVGFEPTRPLRATVFETVPLSHSGTPPL